MWSALFLRVSIAPELTLVSSKPANGVADLIDYEKTTPNPFAASDPPLSSPANAYELLKLEIDYYIECFLDRNGKLPSNDEIQLEACRVILAAESGSAYGANTNPTTISNSWLR